MINRSWFISGAAWEVLSARELLMSYASMLVHVENDSASSDARLDLAVSLAHRFQASLIGVAAEAVRPPPPAVRLSSKL